MPPSDFVGLNPSGGDHHLILYSCVIRKGALFSTSMATSLRRMALSAGWGVTRTASSSPSMNVRSFASDAISTEIKRGEIGIVSGIPKEHLRRKVIIYSPSRSATQQGSRKVGKWRINFISTQKWENPLMGWTSTGDPYANVGEAGLYFLSKEAAIRFAERHGWEVTVKEPHRPLIKPKSYADNFKWKGPPVSEDE